MGDEMEYNFRINQVHIGTSCLVDFPFRPCAKALDMGPVTYGMKGKTICRYCDPDLKNCVVHPWQLTGACVATVGAIDYMLVRASLFAASRTIAAVLFL